MTTTDASTTSLAELAVRTPGASRVFHRYGLDYCCGGRRPLAEACAAKNLDAADVLAALAADERPSENQRWESRPLAELIEHIVSFFHARLRAELPQLVALARKVEVRHADKPTRPAGLAVHLETFLAELLSHLEKEEQVLFPAILAGWGPRALMPISTMEAEHRDAAIALEKIRALTGNLVPPAEACTSWRALYLRLDEFEAELMEHIHLENNVLFTRTLGA